LVFPLPRLDLLQQNPGTANGAGLDAVGTVKLPNELGLILAIFGLQPAQYGGTNMA
jgi:hypothetical protein